MRCDRYVDGKTLQPSTCSTRAGVILLILRYLRCTPEALHDVIFFRIYWYEREHNLQIHFNPVLFPHREAVASGIRAVRDFYFMEGDEMEKEKDITVNDFFDNKGVDLSGLDAALKKYSEFINDHREEFEFIFDILGTDARKQREKIDERFITMTDAEQFAYAMGYKDAGEYHIEIIHKLIDELRQYRNNSERIGQSKTLKLRGKSKEIAMNKSTEFKDVYFGKSINQTAQHFKIHRDAVQNIADYLGLSQ